MEEASIAAAPLEIECSDLEVRFSAHVPVLERLSCKFPAGQIVVLLGRSGCGKSTLLRCVAGLQKPTSGVVRLSAVGGQGHQGRGHAEGLGDDQDHQGHHGYG